MSEEDVLRACRELNIRPDALGFVTAAQVCCLLSISRRTLFNYRDSGEGPDYILLGGRMRFHVRAIAAYLDALGGKHGQGDA